MKPIHYPYVTLSETWCKPRIRRRGRFFIVVFGRIRVYCKNRTQAKFKMWELKCWHDPNPKAQDK